jgi:hypothetical protein
MLREQGAMAVVGRIGMETGDFLSLVAYILLVIACILKMLG